MTRRQALLKLHRRLKQRRRELVRSVEQELNELTAPGEGGDPADMAAETEHGFIGSSLAEHESAELHHIDRTLARMRQGKYGICELCEKRIPMLRLNALPYTTHCIQCQRELERADGTQGGSLLNWERVWSHEAADSDRDRIDFSKIDS